MTLPGRGNRVVPRPVLPDLSLAVSEVTPGVYNILRAMYGALKSLGAHLQNEADAATLGGGNPTIGDVNYGILPTDDSVSLIATLTASRKWRLPAANSVVPGKTVWILDRVGGVSATFPLSITNSVGDTQAGIVSGFTLNNPYDAYCFMSDGVRVWQQLTHTTNLFGGEIAFAPESVLSTLVNGANQNVNVDIGGQTHTTIRLTAGPVAPFSIGGILNGVGGRILLICNDTGQTLTFNHVDGGSNFGNQIHTATAGNISAGANSTTSILVYDSGTLFWNLVTPLA